MPDNFLVSARFFFFIIILVLRDCEKDVLYLRVEGGGEVVCEDTNIKKEGDVSNIHPEGCLGRFPVDMFAMREKIERRRRIRRHCFCFR